MTAHDSTLLAIAAPPPSDAAEDRPALSPPAEARLCHLFRASLKNGLIHPLYLPVLRYRHAQAAA